MRQLLLWGGVAGFLGIGLSIFFLAIAYAQTTPGSSQSLTEDVSPLAGKRICLDPGHGGSQTGAVGVGGLRESDVNLRVALILKELLEQAGATVLMTRTDDSTVSIAERREFNKKHNTDLFVSIHHNANAQVDRTVNRTEVFYHWHDRGGPSEDAARHIYRELQATFKLPDSKVYMCWAYGVLRENSYPAVLGEASYISNPEEERRLRDEKYLRAEAEAYFRGIKAFFAGGRPQVVLEKRFLDSNKHILRAILKQPDGSAIIDPQRIRVELGGEPLSHVYYDVEKSQLYFYIPDSRSSEEELVLSARNLAGHTSRVKRIDMNLSHGWASGAHLSNGTLLRILGKKKSEMKPVPLTSAEIFSPEAERHYYIADDKGLVTVYFKPSIRLAYLTVSARGYWTRTLVINPWKKAGTTNPEKKIPTPSDAPTLDQQIYEILLEPMFRGVLHGKVIVVDPEGGGDDPGPIGNTGLRAADANLNTAFYLADYLRQAGADVSLTRTMDVSMDNVSRVRFGLERNPDVFLTIGHRLPEPGLGEKPGMNVTRIGHRWSSGRPVAKSLIFHLRQLLGTGAGLGDITSREPLPGEIHNWSSWEVMHAAQRYTAVYVCPQMFDAPGVEVRLSTTAGCRKEALAILYGLIQYFGLDDRTMASIEGGVVDSKTRMPLHNTLVWLDDTLLTQTESDGKFLIKYIEPGHHTITAQCQGYPITKKVIDVKKAEQLKVQIELSRKSL
ncbi:N-acetylmuramoyl-L-alanine amidase [Candidatus Sumerlaeota bacterium]|nr:N-acetylmuramoyl-L-alanine amidase [Candidatus Sumerlaeota bacterium]